MTDNKQSAQVIHHDFRKHSLDLNFSCSCNLLYMDCQIILVRLTYTLDGKPWGIQHIAHEIK